MSRYSFLYLFFTATSAFGQQAGALPDAVVRDIAKDLAEMQKAVDEAKRKQEASSYAQFLKGQGIAAITVTAPTASIKAGASDAARNIATAKQGTKYRVIDKVDDWYAVALDRPIGGLTSGWLKAADSVPVVASGSIYAAQNTTVSEAIYRQLVEQASRFRKAYEENAYVTVSGFDVGTTAHPNHFIPVQREAVKNPGQLPFPGSSVIAEKLGGFPIVAPSNLFFFLLRQHWNAFKR